MWLLKLPFSLAPKLTTPQLKLSDGRFKDRLFQFSVLLVLMTETLFATEPEPFLRRRTFIEPIEIKPNPFWTPNKEGNFFEEDSFQFACLELQPTHSQLLRINNGFHGKTRIFVLRKDRISLWWCPTIKVMLSNWFKCGRSTAVEIY